MRENQPGIKKSRWQLRRRGGERRGLGNTVTHCVVTVCGVGQALDSPGSSPPK